MNDGDVVGKFHDKDVVVTSGTVEWSEVYGTYGKRAKQSIKIKGKPDMISTCSCINKSIEKGDVVSAFTVVGINERIILGKVIKGGPEGLQEYSPPEAEQVQRREEARDIRDFKGVITTCNIRKRYGVERQWIRAITGQMFITRKHINRELKPFDEVSFKWFWNADARDKFNRYRTPCSAITITKKHEDN